MKNVLLRTSCLSVCIWLLASCSDRSPVAWELPPAETAQVVRLPVVERNDTVIRFKTVDLAIEGPDRRAAPVGRIGGLVVDRAGTSFLLDSTAGLIHSVLPTGSRGRSFGGLGQGPGEFSPYAKQLAIVDDTLVVADRLNARFSQWSASGEHLGDLPFSPLRILVRFEGLPNGQFFVEYLDTRVSGGNVVLAQLDSQFRVENELVRVEATRGARFRRDDREFAVTTLLEQPRLLASISPGGGIYVSPGDAYQVLRFDSTGNAQWALAVDAEPQLVPEEAKRAALDEYLEERRRTDAGFDLRFGEIDWPTYAPAVSALLVDGFGRIWVFPFVGSTELPTQQRPLDIYDAEGGRLFSGYVELETDRDTLTWPLGRYVVANEDGFYALVRLVEDDRLVVRKFEYPRVD